MVFFHSPAAFFVFATTFVAVTFDLQVLILGGGIYPQGPIGLDKPGDLLVVM